jgi:hypothetical protein
MRDPDGQLIEFGQVTDPLSPRLRDGRSRARAGSSPSTLLRGRIKAQSTAR